MSFFALEDRLSSNNQISFFNHYQEMNLRDGSAKGNSAMKYFGGGGIDYCCTQIRTRNSWVGSANATSVLYFLPLTKLPYVGIQPLSFGTFVQ